MEHKRIFWQNCLKLFILLFLSPLVSHSAIIQRTITINGSMTDWTTAPNITTNSGQFSTDADGNTVADLDSPLSSVGRDLKTFSYTYDANKLYVWVERFSNANNSTDWWFYLDTSNDGNMQSGEKVLNVKWTGSNGNTALTLYNYVQSRTGGDPLLCPATGTNSVATGWCSTAGTADGYDMPGSLGTSTSLGTNSGGCTAGGCAGTQMEAEISWANIGLGGPSSIGFHISSSNGSNLPNNLIDNMSGPNGGASISFADLEVTKTTNDSIVNSNASFTYTITVTNNGPSDATTVTLNDDLPSGITYSSHTASQGTYDSGTGIWTIGTIANGASVTLSITATADPVTADTVRTNTANGLTLAEADPTPANDTDSVDVTVKPLPNINTVKTAQTISDPYSGTTSPKNVPGTIKHYTLTITNTGFGGVDSGTFIIVDPIPTQTKFCVDDRGAPGSGPIVFTNGATSSGLTYAFTSLASITDNLSFSNDSGATYAYTPTADADGCDTNITHIRINPSGSFAASNGVNNPSFSVLFRTIVE